ncbi:MgtC/SapB family protein [Tissierella sp.]|uniref:MgtC/SapB family protein n=1 Tax=Tissierella sp. TaxID=41274 RepID=UPI0028A8D90B|nr:MgtC/SapB family protein [Tissierella sp.]
MIDNVEIILRIILSAIIGGLIGMEREANNRPAGLRTHVLVSVGSALIMLISMYGFYDLKTGLRIGDPSRLAAQVVSGIGFLGAGTIIRTGSHIKGLTTAASLWVCAGIGLAIGNGYYLGGLLTAAVVLLTLGILSAFEKRIFKTKYKNLEIAAIDRTGLIGEIGVLLGRYNIDIIDIGIVNINDDGRNNDILTSCIKVRLPVSINLDNFFQDIYNINGILEAIFIEEN